MGMLVVVINLSNSTPIFLVSILFWTIMILGVRGSFLIKQLWAPTLFMLRYHLSCGRTLLNPIYMVSGHWFSLCNRIYCRLFLAWARLTMGEVLSFWNMVTGLMLLIQDFITALSAVSKQFIDASASVFEVNVFFRSIRVLQHIW